MFSNFMSLKTAVKFEVVLCEVKSHYHCKLAVIQLFEASDPPCQLSLITTGLVFVKRSPLNKFNAIDFETLQKCLLIADI